MYKMLSTPNSANMFSISYKNKVKRYSRSYEEYWENMFWDHFMPYIIDVLDELGIEIDYSYLNREPALVFYTVKDNTEISVCSWLDELAYIKDIWLSDKCKSENEFIQLLRYHYISKFWKVRK